MEETRETLAGKGVPGIGVARATRLAELGITDLQTLAAADPDALATALHGSDTRDGLWRAARRLAVAAVDHARQELGMAAWQEPSAQEPTPVAPPPPAPEPAAADEGEDDDEAEGADEGEADEDEADEDEADDEDGDDEADDEDTLESASAEGPPLGDLRRTLANARSLLDALRDVVRESPDSGARDRARKAIKRLRGALSKLEEQIEEIPLPGTLSESLEHELERARRRWDALLAKTMNKRRLRRARKQARRLRKMVRAVLEHQQGDEEQG